MSEAFNFLPMFIGGSILFAGFMTGLLAALGEGFKRVERAIRETKEDECEPS